MAYKVVSRAPTVKDVTSLVADNFGGDKKAAKLAVDATVAAIQKMLTTQGCVQLSGFGRFAIGKLARRTCRNPRTGEKITVPSRKKVGFRMSKAWKKKIKE